MWLVGPTPARPTEEWLPAATDVMAGLLGFGPGKAREREIVRDVLGLTARRQASPLPLFVLRWPAPTADPLSLHFGLCERADQETIETWISGADGLTLEPPIVEDLPAPPGMTLTRLMAYSHGPEDAVMANLRYVVDTGHHEAVVLAHTVTFPGEMMGALDDIEDFLRTMAVTDSPLPVRTDP